MKRFLFVFTLSFLTGWGAIAQDNPYDFIGEIHNKAMDDLIAKKSAWYAENKDSGLDKLKGEAADVTYELIHVTHTGDIDENGLRTSIQKHINNMPSIQEIQSGDFMEMIEDEDLGDKARGYITELLLLEGSFESILSRVSAMEKEVISSDFEGKVICLMSLAIAKHSYQYWHEQSINGRSAWHYSLESEAMFEIDWGGIAKADVGGAVVGGVRGVITGISSGALVMGPGGVVLTAVGGAVTGAIWSSAASAALWSWW